MFRYFALPIFIFFLTTISLRMKFINCIKYKEDVLEHESHEDFLEKKRSSDSYEETSEKKTLFNVPKIIQPNIELNKSFAFITNIPTVAATPRVTTPNETNNPAVQFDTAHTNLAPMTETTVAEATVNHSISPYEQPSSHSFNSSSHDSKTAKPNTILPNRTFTLQNNIEGVPLRQKQRVRYLPTWESIDSRPCPVWYDQAKLGVFVHWGIYSVPAFGTSDQLDGYAEWFLHEWKGLKNKDFVEFMNKNYPPDFQYSDFLSYWKAEFFDPKKWAELVEESGAKYFVLTSKHHDGYTLWQSNVSSNWNSVDTGPHRDVVGELADAIRRKGNIHFGLYYSLFEWYHPLYLLDKKNNFTTQEYVKKVMLPQMYDCVTKYRPEYIWSDGDWEAGYEYWNSPEFLAWLYNDSPVRDKVMVNDRWGIGTACKHGDVKTCGIDRFNPKAIQYFKWENAMTIDRHSWGYRRNAHLNDYLTIYDLIYLLVETVSCGGNLIMNIGPTADGRIVPIYQERLRQIGSWLKVNGEGIYSTKPWRVQNDTEVMRTWYTRKDVTIYAVVLDWPLDDLITLVHPIPTAETRIFMLGYPIELQWQLGENNVGIKIDVSHFELVKLPCQWAWTFKLTHVE